MSSSSSGPTTSLLGTGVNLGLDVGALKFGLLDVLRGLDLSGSLTALAEVGVLEKNAAILFWPDDEPAFCSVAGVDDAGVDPFLAILNVYYGKTEPSV